MKPTTSAALSELSLFHDHLAAWLGDAVSESWTYLTAALDADFELIALNGARFSRTALVETLRGQGRTVPGLEIEVRQPKIHFQDALHLWVTFLERHSTGETRVTTAFLVRTRISRRWTWRFVQETSAQHPSVEETDAR